MDRFAGSVIAVESVFFETFAPAIQQTPFKQR
jgi:hypothetical protein